MADLRNRTSAPYSLSIWTRYLVGGYEFHDGFQPKGCKTTIKTTAVTAGAASYVSDIYYNLSLLNQTVVDGLGPEVTMGGYLTGGGHSPISNIYGLGSDQVYEVEMVTPAGKIITANECQNTDLFWAVRGVSTEFFIDFWM
jgi:FAD binding domain